MYLKHFGMVEFPFGITPDTSFVYATTGHQEALNTLLVALRAGEGFVKITGEVGTGKTLLCRRLLQNLGDKFVTAYLPNPNLEPRTLYLALAEELRLKVAPDIDQYHLLKSLNKRLLDIAREGKSTVVCIDEAQAMPLESLEALRLLSNLETEKRKLLQWVILGQPELDKKLGLPEIRQLRQRIAFHYRLPGLGRREVAAYVAHRLRVAGYRGEELFSSGAIKGLHRASRGTPRLINILAHKALLAVFGEGDFQVRGKHIKAAARDTEGTRSLRLWW